DYLVTVDDRHGGTSTRTVSIPLAEILSGVGDGGPTTQPPVFLDTAPPNSFTSGHDLGQLTDNPFIFHPSFPPAHPTTDLFVQGTLHFSDPDGGHHLASVDLAHAVITSHLIADPNGAHPVSGAPVVGTSTGTWQVFVQEPGEVFWSYTL